MAFKPLTVNTPVGEKAHILAEDDAALYDGIFGEDCVLKLGEQFASKTISNNVIRIMDGVVVVGGHVGRIIKGDYEDMMIDNGGSGQKRNDLIVAQFKSGGTGGADTYSLVVVKGTPGATAKDPAIVREDLYAGGKQRDYPLYRVRIENLSVVGVDKLFQVNRNFKVLAEEFESRFKTISSGSVLDVKENGIYYLKSTVTDTPNNSGAAILLVSYFDDNNKAYGCICGGNKLYVRRFYGHTDSGWVEGLNVNDIATKETKSDTRVYSTNYVNDIKQTLESRTNGALRLYENDQGGGIEFTEKGTERKWRMNLLNGVFRLYSELPGNKYCLYKFPTTEAGGTGGTVGTVEQINKKMDLKTIVNNLTTTVAGTILDGRIGKTLNDAINAVKNRVTKLEGYRAWRKIGYSTTGSVSIKGLDVSEYLVFVKFNATTSTEGIITISIPAVAPSGYYFDGYDYAGSYSCSACVHYTQGASIKLLSSWCGVKVPGSEAITANWRFEVYAR